MKIDPLFGRNPVRTPGIEELNRACMVQIVADILDEKVRSLVNFLFDDERRFGGEFMFESGPGGGALAAKNESNGHATAPDDKTLSVAGSSGTRSRDNPMTGYTGNTLSNGTTLNGAGGTPGPNARAAASRGTTDKAMDAAKSLGNTNTGILAPNAATNSTTNPSSKGTSSPPQQ